MNILKDFYHEVIRPHVDPTKAEQLYRTWVKGIPSITIHETFAKMMGSIVGGFVLEIICSEGAEGEPFQAPSIDNIQYWTWWLTSEDEAMSIREKLKQMDFITADKNDQYWTIDSGGIPIALMDAWYG